MDPSVDHHQRNQSCLQPALTKLTRWCSPHGHLKMFRTTLLLLVLTALMLNMDSADAWRRRRFFRRLKRAAVSYVAQKAAGAAIAAIGKRDAACADLAQQEAAQVVEELEKQCPKLAVDPAVGLTRATVDDLLEDMDENKDGALTEQELDNFRQVIDSYDVCLGLEGAKRK